MSHKLFLLLIILLMSIPNTMSAEAKFLIAQNGQAQCVIIRQPGATPAERHVADELAATLQQITAASFEVRESLPNADESAIIVGPGSMAASLFPEVALDTFGSDELV
ncbi:MAG: hypothetical protein M3347_01235, partial [Armatimonadota bacterium]|nr:hypothetical protein [Armatimonadota bacterium]